MQITKEWLASANASKDTFELYDELKETDCNKLLEILCNSRLNSVAWWIVSVIKDFNGIVIPNKSGWLFFKDANLQGITFPEKQHGGLAFQNCNLQGIILPKEIDGDLNIENHSLTGITFPSKITGTLFSKGCNLKGIELPTDTKMYQYDLYFPTK